MYTYSAYIDGSKSVTNLSHCIRHLQQYGRYDGMTENTVILAHAYIGRHHVSGTYVRLLIASYHLVCMFWFVRTAHKYSKYLHLPEGV